MSEREQTPLEKLAAAIESLALHNVKQTETMLSQAENIGRIRYVLEGNGTPGLIKLVDRHEQKLGNIGKFFWIVVTGMVGLAITTATYVSKTAYAMKSEQKQEIKDATADRKGR